MAWRTGRRAARNTSIAIELVAWGTLGGLVRVFLTLLANLLGSWGTFLVGVLLVVAHRTVPGHFCGTAAGRSGFGVDGETTSRGACWVPSEDTLPVFQLAAILASRPLCRDTGSKLGDGTNYGSGTLNQGLATEIGPRICGIISL